VSQIEFHSPVLHAHNLVHGKLDAQRGQQTAPAYPLGSVVVVLLVLEQDEFLGQNVGKQDHDDANVIPFEEGSQHGHVSDGAAPEEQDGEEDYEEVDLGEQVPVEEHAAEEGHHQLLLELVPPPGRPLAAVRKSHQFHACLDVVLLFGQDFVGQRDNGHDLGQHEQEGQQHPCKHHLQLQALRGGFVVVCLNDGVRVC